LIGNKKESIAKFISRIPFFSSTIFKFTDSFFHPRIGKRPNTPAPYAAPYLFDASAALVISADFELSWAWMYASAEERTLGLQDRINFNDILQILEKFNVPITWATVGHLFLDSCSRDLKAGLPHSELSRPKKHYKNAYWEWNEEDWYQHDPCSDLKSHPDWYAPDLILKILHSKVKHEIGTHTFSHIDFSDTNCDTILADSEISECINVMKFFNLVPRSIVFPGNFAGNFKILREKGIISYRGVGRIELSYPSKMNGLWNIRQSIFLFSRDYINYLKKMKRYTEIAIKYNMVVHMGFHPADLDKKRVNNILIPFFKYVSNKRENGDIWIATMYDIAKYCEAIEKTTITVKSENNKNELHVNLRTTIDFQKYEKPHLTLKIPIPNHKKIKKVICDEDRIVSIGTQHCFIKNSRILLLTLPLTIKNIRIYFN
jgi:peptidoglycan/xylan/chitin deacetylase (PgdA/CDA1 family)